MPVNLPSRPESDVDVVLGSISKAPRWVSVVGIIAIVMTLLFLVAHLILVAKKTPKIDTTLIQV